MIDVTALLDRGAATVRRSVAAHDRALMLFVATMDRRARYGVRWPPFAIRGAADEVVSEGTESSPTCVVCDQPIGRRESVVHLRSTPMHMRCVDPSAPLIV